jgi:hypothetical protein
VRPRVSSSLREVAERANVPERLVRRLVEVGARSPVRRPGLGPREVRRVRLLDAWAAAGLSVERIVELVDRGALSLSTRTAPTASDASRQPSLASSWTETRPGGCRRSVTLTRTGFRMTPRRDSPGRSA